MLRARGDAGMKCITHTTRRSKEMRNGMMAINNKIEQIFLMNNR